MKAARKKVREFEKEAREKFLADGIKIVGLTWQAGNRGRKGEGKMKIINGKIASREVWIDGKPLTPYKSLRVIRHSPDGFNWGYGGSGPAQLSLAIMLELTPEDIAKRIYQDFKWEFVAKWRGDFCVPLDSVTQWIKATLEGEERSKEK